MTSEEIIAALCDPGTAVPSEALAEVVRRKEEFVPLLIAALKNAGQQIDSGNCLPLFALYLLAEMREPRALEPILEMLASDEEVESTELWEINAMDGAHILAGVAHENPEALRDFVKRDDISEEILGSALIALALLARWGKCSRDSAVEFFQELMDTEAYGEDYAAWAALVGACRQLHPRECLDRIRRLYEQGLVDETMEDSFEAVAEEAAMDFAAHQARDAEHRQPITDTAQAVSWWDRFADPNEMLDGADFDEDGLEQPVEGMDVTRIIERLRFPWGEIPFQEVNEALRRWEEFAPRLIAAIEDATRLGDDVNADDCLAGTALFLLAEKRERKALVPILQYFAIDSATETDIFGEFLGLNGGRVLAAVGHTDPHTLEEFARRKDLSPWALAAALDALGFLALWGERPRGTFVDFIREMIDTRHYGREVMTWTELVHTCLEFYPAELLEHIEKLFAHELVDVASTCTFDVVRRAVEARPTGMQIRSPEWLSPITSATATLLQWADYTSGDADWHDNEAESRDAFEREMARPFVELPGETIRAAPKIGRNDLCPCRSGKKYKKCCLPPG